MNQAVGLFILSLVFCGCARTGENFSFSNARYRGADRQTEYVTMRVPLNSRGVIGKSKDEIRTILGEPARIENQMVKGIDAESWMYYPESTANFIAIIIRFTGETATTCQYESVL